MIRIFYLLGGTLPFELTLVKFYGLGSFFGVGIF